MVATGEMVAPSVPVSAATWSPPATTLPGRLPALVSRVDQARGTALRLLEHLRDAGADLAERDPHLARVLAEDPAFFWARGEERPPGTWPGAAGEGW